MPRTATADGFATSELGALYISLAARLEQIVRRDVRASEAVVEDACQFAWGRLVAHSTHVRRDRALSWLATTAVREAWRLLRRQRRDVPLDTACDASASGPSPLPAPACEDLVENRERVMLIRTLPERQQRILWLHALGLSYGEIAAYTGDTRRTVERQLLRARQRVRGLSADRHETPE